MNRKRNGECFKHTCHILDSIENIRVVVAKGKL